MVNLIKFFVRNGQFDTKINLQVNFQLKLVENPKRLKSGGDFKYFFHHQC